MSFESARPTRRRLLAGCCAVLTGAAGDNAGGLRKLAALRGLTFGSELGRAAMLLEPRLGALAARECAVIAPGNEAKWDHVQPAQGKFRFADLDWMADFAGRAEMALYLHVLVWHEALPDWVGQAVKRGQGRRVLAAHIATVVGRYRGRVRAWDVANEICNPQRPTGPEGLRLTLWRQALGPDIVPEAFHLAHDADPHAILCINDSDLEHNTRDAEWTRATYLRLIETWKRQGVPIHGFGLQGHLRPDQPFDARIWRRFLSELASLGLELHVTELDVLDRSLPADPAIRDRRTADCVSRFLDVTLDEKAVTTVMTWGLSDRFSFHQTDPDWCRLDGKPSRPLPFDEHLVRKPMYAALATALAAAPVRG